MEAQLESDVQATFQEHRAPATDSALAEVPGARRWIALAAADVKWTAARLSCVDLTWYARFLTKRAPNFLIEHQLQTLPFAQQLDVLVFCRHALATGGRVRIALPDGNHPSPAYQALLARSGVSGRPTLEGWTWILERLGFLVRVVEGYRRDGSFVAADPDFDLYGPVRRSSRLDPRGTDPALRMSALILDAVKQDASVPDPAWPERIYGIGDSHARFLGGRDDTLGRRLDGYGNWYEDYSARMVGLHIGPALAHNANRAGSRTRAHEKICALLEGGDRVPRGAQILFSFGEIDIRCHVVRRAEANGGDMDAAVDDICGSYIGLLERVAAAGYRPGAWGPVAPSLLTQNRDPEFPIVGSFEMRLAATRRFHATMARLCAERGFAFLGILERLLDADGRTDRSLYCDAIHVGQRARPILNEVLPPLGGPEHCHGVPVPPA